MWQISTTMANYSWGSTMSNLTVTSRRGWFVALSLPTRRCIISETDSSLTIGKNNDRIKLLSRPAYNNTAATAKSSRPIPLVSRSRGAKWADPNTQQIKLIYCLLAGCTSLYKTVSGKVTTPGNTYIDTCPQTHMHKHLTLKIHTYKQTPEGGWELCSEKDLWSYM